MKKNLRRIVGVALVTIGGHAAAQGSCSSALSSYYSYVLIGDTAQAQYIVSNHPQCFSGSASAQASINATTVVQTNAITNTLTSRFLTGSGPVAVASTGMTGMSAGGKIDKWNVWGNLSDNHTRTDYINASNGTTKNRLDTLTTVAGFDYALSQTMVLGLSASIDRGDGSGKTNANAADDVDTRGYQFAPYFGMQINQNWAFDVSTGLGKGKMDTSGTKTDIDRAFGAANLSYVRWVQNFQFTGKLGYLHAIEDGGNSKKADGTVNLYTKNKNTLDQFRLGLQAGYWINGFMPYAGVTYTTDHRKASNGFMDVDPIGKNAFLWSLGVNYFSLANKITGGIVFNQETNRTHSKNNSLMANMNIRF